MSVRINVGATFNARDLQRAQRELDALKRSVTTLSGRMQAFATKMNTVGSSMSRVGRSLSRNVTAPLAAVGGFAVKTAAEFETSFAKIQGLVGVAAEDIGQLEEAARTLGAQYGRSANEAAEALFFITSAGLRGADAVETLEASLKASVVGLGETQVVADLATSALNAYGSDVLSAAAATDVLTNAVRLGKLQPEDLAGAMGQVLPIASAMGVEFHEVGAAFAAMSRTGTNAEVAATQLRQIMATILSPTTEAEQAMTAVGLSAEGLREQIRDQGLLSVLQTLVDRFDGNTAATAQVFGNIRALSGVLDLMGSNAAATVDIFDGMASSTGVLDEAFGIAADTSAFRFQQAIADLKESLLELGQDLMPVAEDLIAFLKDVADGFRSLTDDQQAFIIKAAAVMAVVGPLIVVLGSLATAIGGVATAAAFLAANPIVLGIAGLAAVVGGLAVAYGSTSRAEQEAHTVAMRNRAAQSDAAAAYLEKGEAAREAARQVAREADASRYAALAAAYAAGELDHLADAGRKPNMEMVRLGAAMERANALLEDAADATEDVTLGIGGTGGLGDVVVDLSEEMRAFLQELNDAYAGLGGAEAQVAEFARELLAAGHVTEATAGQVEELARAVRSDLEAALRDGQGRLDEARRTFEAYRDAIAGGITSGNTFADAARSQASALDALTRAEEDYQRAVASGDAGRIAEAADALELAQGEQGSLLEFLGQSVVTAEGFAAQVEALVAAGASLDVVRQIAELGARTGGRAAAELLAGGAEAIRQANELTAAVAAAAQRVGTLAAQRFYGAGIAAAEAFVDALESRLEDLEGVLTKIAGMVDQAMAGAAPAAAGGGAAPTVPTGGGGGGGAGPTPRPTPPIALDQLGSWERRFASGVRFLADGGLVTGPTLGIVGEAGPELVIPLDRLDGTGGGSVVNVTVTSADPVAVVDAIRKYTRRNGPLGATVRI